MAGHQNSQGIPLPRGWSEHVRSAMLQVIALAQYALAYTRGWAANARQAGMKQSLIFLLGAGGVERSVEHATASARLTTAMDPEFLSTLTLMLIPSTPIYKLAQTERFQMPSVEGLLRELRIIVGETNPSDAIFRCNHASNYLPIGGRLPRDREAILQQIDAALSGEVPFRTEWSRGL